MDCGCAYATGAAIINNITILLWCLNFEEGIRADMGAKDENDKEAEVGRGHFSSENYYIWTSDSARFIRLLFLIIAP